MDKSFKTNVFCDFTIDIYMYFFFNCFNSGTEYIFNYIVYYLPLNRLDCKFHQFHCSPIHMSNLNTTVKGSILFIDSYIIANTLQTSALSFLNYLRPMETAMFQYLMLLIYVRNDGTNV